MPLTRTDFETGLPPVFAAASLAGWAIVSDPDTVSGTTKALQSKAIGVVAVTEFTFSVTLNAAATNFLVRYKVESETGFDFFKVFDGVTQILSDSGTAGGWETFSTSLSAGAHTIKFQYSKDSSGTGGFDAVRVAFIEVDGTVATINQIEVPAAGAYALPGAQSGPGVAAAGAYAVTDTNLFGRGASTLGELVSAASGEFTSVGQIEVSAAGAYGIAGAATGLAVDKAWAWALPGSSTGVAASASAGYIVGNLVPVDPVTAESSALLAALTSSASGAVTWPDPIRHTIGLSGTWGRTRTSLNATWVPR